MNYACWQLRVKAYSPLSWINMINFSHLPLQRTLWRHGWICPRPRHCRLPLSLRTGTGVRCCRFCKYTLMHRVTPAPSGSRCCCQVGGKPRHSQSPLRSVVPLEQAEIGDIKVMPLTQTTVSRNSIRNSHKSREKCFMSCKTIEQIQHLYVLWTESKKSKVVISSLDLHMWNLPWLHISILIYTTLGVSEQQISKALPLIKSHPTEARPPQTQ